MATYLLDEAAKSNLKVEMDVLLRNTETCYLKMTNNPPWDENMFNQERINSQMQGYSAGLAMELADCDDPLLFDDNMLTSQFVSQLKKRINKTEQLIAYRDGVIADVRKETLRLEKLKAEIKKALELNKTATPDATPVQIQAAKQKFLETKSDLHRLIRCLFPKHAEGLIEILGELVQAYTQREDDGYLEITNENRAVVEILKATKMISSNPYNIKLVKLLY